MQLHGQHPQTIDGNRRRKLTENHLQVSKFPSWTNSAYHVAKKKKKSFAQWTFVANFQADNPIAARNKSQTL